MDNDEEWAVEVELDELEWETEDPDEDDVLERRSRERNDWLRQRREEAKLAWQEEWEAMTLEQRQEHLEGELTDALQCDGWEGVEDDLDCLLWRIACNGFMPVVVHLVQSDPELECLLIEALHEGESWEALQQVPYLPGEIVRIELTRYGNPDDPPPAP